jgi:hypothetical protein
VPTQENGIELVCKLLVARPHPHRHGKSKGDPAVDLLGHRDHRERLLAMQGSETGDGSPYDRDVYLSFRHGLGRSRHGATDLPVERKAPQTVGHTATPQRMHRRRIRSVVARERDPDRERAQSHVAERREIT